MILKLAHIVCVVVSGLLFAIRFALLRINPERALPTFLKVLPHVNDTILLVAAIAMLVLAGLSPWDAPWLLAKLIALLAYIVLGAVCLRAIPGSQRQLVFFVLALSLYTYIVLVALSKQVVPMESLV